jgi:hypothetical protein
MTKPSLRSRASSIKLESVHCSSAHGLRLLPAGAIAGWDLHPLENAALSRRTPIPGIRPSARLSALHLRLWNHVRAYCSFHQTTHITRDFVWGTRMRTLMIFTASVAILTASLQALDHGMGKAATFPRRRFHGLARSTKPELGVRHRNRCTPGLSVRTSIRASLLGLIIRPSRPSMPTDSGPSTVTRRACAAGCRSHRLPCAASPLGRARCTAGTFHRSAVFSFRICFLMDAATKIGLAHALVLA